ncbi:hypothetical protein QYF36_020563 [Acer negundo]|nr:hypothetical protein QYF36_020563 [Acer negundo]
MNFFSQTCILLLSCILLHSGYMIQALRYDHSATTKCLAAPGKAHYGGGLIVNPEFDRGVEGWTVFGQGAIKQGTSKESGNRFIVSHSRREPLDSFSQKIQLENGKFYSFSAWVQISEGSETVAAVFKTSDGKLSYGGKVLAKQGCWSLLKGGLVANFTSSAHIIFKSNNTRVEIWADNVSLQSFTKEQWISHQDKSIDKVRKQKVRFHITYANKTAMEGGIGLQGHFNSGKPNLPYMRSALDLLGSFGFPIWLTEVDVDKGSPSQAEYFEEILREAYSHPAVKGIISFTGPEAAGFKVMPLTDKDFKNTAAGDVVDKLLREWKSGDDLVVETSAVGNNGFSEISLFHGDYNLTIKHPVTNSSTRISFKVTKDLPRGTVHVQIDA